MVICDQLTLIHTPDIQSHAVFPFFAFLFATFGTCTNWYGNYVQFRILKERADVLVLVYIS